MKTKYLAIIILALIAGTAVGVYFILNKPQDLGPIVVKHDRKGTLNDVEKLLVGGWKAVQNGFEEEIDFDYNATDGRVFRSYLHSRPAESGDWSLNGDTLTLTIVGIEGIGTYSESAFHSLKVAETRLSMVNSDGLTDVYERINAPAQVIYLNWEVATLSIDENGMPDQQVNLYVSGADTQRIDLGKFSGCPVDETEGKPASAVLFMSCWWAGGGDKLFVYRDASDKLVIKGQVVDEGQEKDQPVKIITTVTIPASSKLEIKPTVKSELSDNPCYGIPKGQCRE